MTNTITVNPKWNWSMLFPRRSAVKPAEARADAASVSQMLEEEKCASYDALFSALLH